MSIKKVGRDGEYHHLLDKKKFLFPCFFAKLNHDIFFLFHEKNLVVSAKKTFKQLPSFQQKKLTL
jgi:hypothetical protein